MIKLRTQEDVNERCLLKRCKTRQEKIDGKLTQDSRKKTRFENHHKQERKCVEDKKSRGFGWKKTNSKDTTRSITLPTRKIQNVLLHFKLKKEEFTRKDYSRTRRIQKNER